MKDSEFLELLNLYVDHEIDAEAARRLEAEVLSHPARRRVYRQYCMIHKACSLLSEEHALAPEERPAAIRDEAPRRWAWGWAAGAGLLAAACIAAFAVFRMHPVGAGLVGGHSGAPVAAAKHRTEASANPLVGLQPVLNFRGFADTGASDLNAPGGAMDVAWSNEFMPPAAAPARRPIPDAALHVSPVMFTSANGSAGQAAGDADGSVIGFEFHK